MARKPESIDRDIVAFNQSERRRKIRSVFKQVALALVLALAAGYGFAVFSTLYEKKEQTNWMRPVTSLEDYEKQGIAVLGETDESDPASTNPYDANISSENYKVKQLLIGGEILTEVESVDSAAPLDIAEIKNELFVTKNKDEIKMLVTWKTSKTARGQIEFAKEGESAKKKIETNSSGYTHTAVLPALDPSSVYTYTITCEDRWGMQKTSDKFVFYTGAPNVSLMDVLEDAAKKVFGWAL